MVNDRNFRGVTEFCRFDIQVLFGNMTGNDRAKSGKEKRTVNGGIVCNERDSV